MNVITASLILFCASSLSTDECDGDVALLQLNSKKGSSHFSSSQVSLSPLERIGPNVHRHKLAFSEANATVSTTEPSYRELEGYWARGGTDVEMKAGTGGRPPTPSEAKAMLKGDPALMGYSYEKSHPDVAYVKTSGSTFVPSKDWVSVARADDYWAKPASAVPATTATGTVHQVPALVAEESRKSALASLAIGETVEEPAGEVFDWEHPPADYAPLKADGHEDESAEHPPADDAPLKADGHEDESAEHPDAHTGGIMHPEPDDHDEESPEEPAGEEPTDEEPAGEEAAGEELAGEEPAGEEVQDAGSNTTTSAPVVDETGHPGSLATGAALGLLAAFCD